MTTEEVDELTKASAEKWAKLWAEYDALMAAIERRWQKAVARRNAAANKGVWQNAQRKKEKRK